MKPDKKLLLWSYIPVATEVMAIDPDNSFLKLRQIKKCITLVAGRKKLPLKKMPLFPGVLFDDLRS